MTARTHTVFQRDEPASLDFGYTLVQADLTYHPDSVKVVETYVYPSSGLRDERQRAAVVHSLSFKQRRPRMYLLQDIIWGKPEVTRRTLRDVSYAVATSGHGHGWLHVSVRHALNEHLRQRMDLPWDSFVPNFIWARNRFARELDVPVTKTHPSLPYNTSLNSVLGLMLWPRSNDRTCAALLEHVRQQGQFHYDRVQAHLWAFEMYLNYVPHVDDVQAANVLRGHLNVVDDDIVEHLPGQSMHLLLTERADEGTIMQVEDHIRSFLDGRWSETAISVKDDILCDALTWDDVARALQQTVDHLRDEDLYAEFYDSELM